MKGDLFGRLSSQERDCLGPENMSSPDIFAMPPTSPATGTQVIRCLNEENQFQLHMSNARSATSAPWSVPNARVASALQNPLP